MTALAQHQKLTELIKSERKITESVLKVIQEIDASKAYLEIGYSSLFDYLTKAQKYSESAAQRRISAARLIKELPGIQPKIQTGEINLTQLSKLAMAVKQEERISGKKVPTQQKQEIVSRMSHKTGFETEQLLSQELNYSRAITEKIIPKAEDVMLTLLLTKSQYEKLQKVKSHLSHTKHDAGFAEIIEALCDKLIQKKEGKPEPQKNTKVTSDVTTATAVNKSFKQKNGRVTIPAHIQRQVFRRANYCCEYQSMITGIRCKTPYQLQVDHCIPVAMGAATSLGTYAPFAEGTIYQKPKDGD